jgi:hypothetical protein
MPLISAADSIFMLIDDAITLTLFSSH